jgi:hypothetical protein
VAAFGFGFRAENGLPAQTKAEILSTPIGSVAEWWFDLRIAPPSAVIGGVDSQA